MTDEYTKHTLHTDALDTLGSIIGPDEKRDAIHLAVYPVEAGELLQPGDHVYLNEDGVALKARWAKSEGVGIVDPFLRDPVQPDCRFWLVVYPRQITSLRHVWEHDAFPPSGEAPDLVVEVYKGKSEEWLRGYAKDMDLTFEELISDFDRDHYDDYVTIHGTDANGGIDPDVWDHLEAYLGKKFPHRPTTFSCSC